MQCPRCQRDNPPQSKFCLECGTGLTLRCASCGIDLPEGAKFCNQCGQPMSAGPEIQPRISSPDSYTPKHLAERILTSKSALEGERKQVTVLFCDITNSSAMAERVGPEAERAAKNLFAYSVLYLFLLFAALLVEQSFGLSHSSIPLPWTS